MKTVTDPLPPRTRARTDPPGPHSIFCRENCTSQIYQHPSRPAPRPRQEERTKVTTVPSASTSLRGTYSTPNQRGTIRHAAQYSTPTAMTAMPTRQYLPASGTRTNKHVSGSARWWRREGRKGNVQVVRQRRGVALAVRGVQERRDEHWGWRASATVRQLMGGGRTEYGCCEEEYREGPPYCDVGVQHTPRCTERLWRTYL